jgi:type IV pilus assembly protein PilO
MPDLRRSRRNIKVALGVLLAVDVATMVVFFSPIVGSTASRKAELNQLWSELQVKTSQVEPLNHLDKKVLAANRQIGDFYKHRFPSHESQILTQFGKLAAENGVTIEAAKYREKDDSDIESLEPVEMDADLSGTYIQLARFINALERDDMFFIINSIELAEQNGPIKLQMKLETYLKAGT